MGLSRRGVTAILMYIYISILIYIVAALALASSVVPVIRYRRLLFRVKHPLQRYMQEWDKLRSLRVRVIDKEIEGSLFAYERIEIEKLAAIAYMLKSREEQRNPYRSSINMIFKLALPLLLIVLILVLATTNSTDVIGLQSSPQVVKIMGHALAACSELLAPIAILLAALFIAALVQSDVNRRCHRLVSTHLPMAMDQLRDRQMAEPSRTTEEEPLSRTEVMCEVELTEPPAEDTE